MEPKNKDIISHLYNYGVLYVFDHLFSLARYTPAWIRPRVFIGYFEDTPEGDLQRLFFNELLRMGFCRTPWQLVLPKETAGVVYKVGLEDSTHLYQYHVRFYKDGSIDCEFESHNFSLRHFSGHRVVDANMLNEFLNETTLDHSVKKAIAKLFDTKEHNWKAIRPSRRNALR